MRDKFESSRFDGSDGSVNSSSKLFGRGDGLYSFALSGKNSVEGSGCSGRLLIEVLSFQALGSFIDNIILGIDGLQGFHSIHSLFDGSYGSCVFRSSFIFLVLFGHNSSECLVSSGRNGSLYGFGSGHGVGKSFLVNSDGHLSVVGEACIVDNCPVISLFFGALHTDGEFSVDNGHHVGDVAGELSGCNLFKSSPEVCRTVGVHKRCFHIVGINVCGTIGAKTVNRELIVAVGHVLDGLIEVERVVPELTTIGGSVFIRSSNGHVATRAFNLPNVVARVVAVEVGTSDEGGGINTVFFGGIGHFSFKCSKEVGLADELPLGSCNSSVSCQ